MSGYGKIRKEIVEKMAPRDSRLCVANGCRFVGVADHGHGFACLCHAGQDPSDWPKITERVIEFEWLGQFIGDILAMHTKPQNGADWREFARQMMADSYPTLLPNEHESLFADRYAYRLMSELRAFVAPGLKRPGPWVPLRLRNPQDWSRARIGGGAQPADTVDNDVALRREDAKLDAARRVAEYVEAAQ